MAVTREQLYEQVWAEPMTKVAARYGVSSTLLAGICDRLNVPHPERGHWAKLSAGKSSPTPPLPAPRPGDELEWSREGKPRRMAGNPTQGQEEQRKTPRPTGRKRSFQHELLIGAREHFEAAKRSDSGYLRPLKKRLVDLFVTNDTLDRALSLASSLFHSLEEQGHRVTFAPKELHFRRPDVDERSEGGRERINYGNTWSPDRPTIAYVGNVMFGLTLFELSDEAEVRYVDGKFVPVKDLPTSKQRSPKPTEWTHKQDRPNGMLCLRASSPYPRVTWERQWRESKESALSSQVTAIVREIETHARTLSSLVAESERQAEIERKQWEAQHERWKREEAERQRELNLKASREELFAIIDAWGLAKQIESFFSDVERRAGELGAEDARTLQNRVTRARALLGGVDALQRFRLWKAPDER
jgi:hypothetical protein